MTLYVDVFEIKKLKKKLDKFESLDRLELSRMLDALATFKIDRKMLTESNIHITLSKISKNKGEKVDKEAIEKAQKIRAAWKNLLVSGQTSDGLKKPLTVQIDSDEDPFDARPRIINNPGKAEPAPIEYDDKQRQKIFECIREKFKALFSDSSKLISFSKQLEAAIFTASETMKVNYAKHARERILVLSDKVHQNEILNSLVSGGMSFSFFAEREPRELLSKHNLTEAEEKAKQWAMMAMQADFYLKNMQTKDSEFQCPKCKQRKIFSAQKQTRSADEPMTTFFKCLTCDFNWKMN